MYVHSNEPTDYHLIITLSSTNLDLHSSGSSELPPTSQICSVIQIQIEAKMAFQSDYQTRIKQ